MSDQLAEATIAYGQSAIKGAVLLNGAAGVALIACIGNNVDRFQEITRSVGLPLSVPIVIFGVGVFFAVLAFGGSYVSQGLYTYDRYKEADNWRYAAITCWALSLVVFLIGSGCSLWYFGYAGI